MSANPHLPQGTHVMERLPDGTLVPTTKILTSDPPRPLHVSADGKMTDFTPHLLSNVRDIVEEHYERRKKATGQAVPQRADVRDLVEKAAEAVIEGGQ
jgi:hypothetical protein